MGFGSWLANRRRKKAERIKRIYLELLAEFLEVYNALKQQFYELKEIIFKRLSNKEVFAKRDEFYGTYQQFLELLESLISINGRWKNIDSKMAFIFGSGVTYLMKYHNNFDYDKALETLNTMEPKLREIESLISSLRLSAVA
ncbi:MAG TPA: hypothetical protein VJI97_04180 [Candidatus Nanoarchaeia archaeon]|nr:hypothetical protein [Candidatus Nanoarchaeia archaeon]